MLLEGPKGYSSIFDPLKIENRVISNNFKSSLNEVSAQYLYGGGYYQIQNIKNPDCEIMIFIPFILDFNAI